ncbi:GNAT family N-acetyltransferase [Neisseriaceae bacterium CLB008]
MKPLILNRVCLRDFVAADRPYVYAGLSHPEVIKHYGISYDSLEATQAQMQWFQDIVATKSGYWLAIETLETRQFVGAIGVSDRHLVHRSAELGYWLLPDYWGQGLMAEALQGFLDFAFGRLGLHNVHALVEVPNQASRQLLVRAGFTLEGIMRECEWKDDGYISLCRYALLRHEFSSGEEVGSED